MSDPIVEAPENAGPRAGRQTMLVLRSRNFLPYLAGNMLSSTGTWFRTLAQAILIYRLTHSAFLLGVVSFSGFAAVFLVAPWAGSVADRFDRRRILIVTQLSATVITACLTLITGLGLATPAVIIGFALVLGVTSAYQTPAMMAFVPSLVQPRFLSTALALNSVTFNIGRAVGPLLAVVVIDSLGTTWAFGINSLTYLPLVAGAWSVHPLAAQVRPLTRPRLRESIRLVLRDRRLAGLLYVIAAMNLATDPAQTLGPAFISRELHHADSLAGLLIGAFGLGAVLCAFTIGHRLQGTRTSLAAMLGLAGVGAAAFSVSPNLGFALASLAVMGFGYLASNTAATTRLQRGVDDAHRGRIMALWTIAFLGIRPLGSLVDGAIASWAGLRVASFMMALPALIGAVVFLFGRARPPAAVAADPGRP